MVDAADASPGVLVEAFHYRFHPLFSRVLGILKSGELGDILEISAWFEYPIPYAPGELRHTLEVGGGALMDLGCYPVHWARSVMGTEPSVVTAEAVQEREHVDVSMQAVLDFDGVPAKIGCSMAGDLPPALDTGIAIRTSFGAMTVVNPLAPHNGHELTIELSAESSSEVVDGKSTYWHQLAHVGEVMSGRAKAITGGMDAVANMRVIDAVYTAAGMRPRGR